MISLSARFKQILVKGLKRNILTIIKVILLALIFSAALLIRLAPTKWGYYLTEFDPYYQYYMASWVADHGWKGFLEWFHWGIDKHFWYPYGRNISKSSLPGVAFAGAFAYLFLKGLGIKISLMKVCCIVPAVMGALTTIFIFLLGSAIMSDIAGLISALIIALNYAYISRTIAGFFDDEAISIPLLVLGLFFFVKAFKSRKRYLPFWAILSGLMLSYVVYTWGASTYMINLLALYVFLTFLLKKEDRKLAASYLILMSIITLSIIALPKRGFHYLMTVNYYLVWLTIALTLLYLFGGKRLSENMHKIAGAILIIVIIGVIALFITKRFYGLSSRYLSVLDPFLRSKIPLVASVGEHRVPTWASLFLDFQGALILAFFELYFDIRSLSKENLLAVTYFVTSFYAACSMVRLAVLSAPAIALLAGMGSYRLFEESFSLISEKFKKTKKGAVRKEHAAITIVLLFIILALPVALPYISSYSASPALIVSSSLPVSRAYNYELLDWLSALEWIRDNVPPNAVIVSWWDYGYWISVMGNRTSVCDNGTINATQIRLVATAFLSNETVALKILKKFNANYVVVFEPYQVPRVLYNYYYAMAPNPQGYGDFGKSTWMARIAFGYGAEDEYLVDVRVSHGQSVSIVLLPANTERAANAVLYKMIFMHTSKTPVFIIDQGVIEYLKNYGFQFKYVGKNGTLVDYTPPKIGSLKYFKLVYESEPNGYVRIFKIMYPEEE